jgi:hypothetical protein
MPQQLSTTMGPNNLPIHLEGAAAQPGGRWSDQEPLNAEGCTPRTVFLHPVSKLREEGCVMSSGRCLVQASWPSP